MFDNGLTGVTCKFGELRVFITLRELRLPIPTKEKQSLSYAGQY